MYQELGLKTLQQRWWYRCSFYKILKSPSQSLQIITKLSCFDTFIQSSESCNLRYRTKTIDGLKGLIITYFQSLTLIDLVARTGLAFCHYKNHCKSLAFFKSMVSKIPSRSIMWHTIFEKIIFTKFGQENPRKSGI